MGENIGEYGAHYWVATEDGFIVDAFPLGRGQDLVRVARELGNEDIVVINKNTQDKLEKETIDKFYKQGVFQYVLNRILMRDVLGDAHSSVQESL